MNFSKDGYCSAPKQSDCENFLPVHDLDICLYCGWGNVCDCAQENDPIEKYIEQLKREAEDAYCAGRLFTWYKTLIKIHKLKRIQRLGKDPLDMIADLLDCKGRCDG